MKILIALLSLLLFVVPQVQAVPVMTQFDAGGVWPTLGDGDDKASTVRALQYLLTGKNFPTAIDGIYGEKTRNQVHEFQLQQKLWRVQRNDPGIVDTVTWEFLAPELRRGNKGYAVRALQTLLRANGHRVALDGYFGPQTQRAVRKFQTRRDLLGGVIEPGVAERFTWCELTGGAAYKGGGG